MMMLALFIALAVVSLTFSQAAVTPTFLGKMAFPSPSFLSFVPGNGKEIDLLITEFSELGDGVVQRLANIGPVFSDPSKISSLREDSLGSGYTWPNEAQIIPAGALSATEISTFCGSYNSTTCRLMTVPDGFLTPGHKTGGLFLQAYDVATAQTKAVSHFSIATVETNWFYHEANWVDINGDGLQDVLAARCNINTLGQATGQLVWFEHPSSQAALTKPWTMHTLSKGPDVITLVEKAPSGLVYVFSAQFFSKKLSVLVLDPKAGGAVLQDIVVDSTLGAADDLHVNDVNGDGRRDLVVTTHEGGSGGFIYSFNLPDELAVNSADKTDLSKFNWNRQVLASGFKVTRAGMNQASPGFIYPYNANPSSKRPTYLVAGDGSQGVHLVEPDNSDPNNQFKFVSTKILEIGGTVGTLAVGDVNEDGKVDFVAPDYDNNMIYFYSMP